jgi:hypothetical protein
VDALETGGAGSRDVLCRPLAAEVGRGAAQLVISVMDSVDGAIPLLAARLARCVAGATIAVRARHEVGMADFEGLDAIVSDSAIACASAPICRLSLPASSFSYRVADSARRRDGGTGTLHVATRYTEIAIRIGAAIDAHMLAG